MRIQLIKVLVITDPEPDKNGTIFTDFFLLLRARFRIRPGNLITDLDSTYQGTDNYSLLQIRNPTKKCRTRADPNPQQSPKGQKISVTPLEICRLSKVTYLDPRHRSRAGLQKDGKSLSHC